MCREPVPERDQLQQEAARLNEVLKSLESTEERIRAVLEYAQETKDVVAQTTSFGIQSCLMLDLLHKAGGASTVPIVWIDTGYLPPETYHFASALESRYALDLQVYQSKLSPARMEAMHGKLWEDPSDEAHRLYNTIRKVEPMQRALRELDASIVLSGLRSSQTKHRQMLQFVNVDGNRLKICPILDWSDQQVKDYFQEERLPYHPLYDQGYRTVGDAHSSEPFDPSIHKNERDTRFHGRSQECGLHVNMSTSSFSVGSLEESTTDSSSISSTSTTETDGFLIYGRPGCRYCRAAKALIRSLSKQLDPGVALVEIEVGKSISKQELEVKLGVSVETVPQVLYKGQHIGGYSDLVAWGNQKYSFSLFADLVAAIAVE